MRKPLTGLATLIFAMTLIAGCSEQEPTTTTQAESPQEEQTDTASQDKGTVKLVYVEWSSEIASTHLVQAILQEKMGYDVRITAVSAAAMWQAIGTGDQDGMVSAWLDTTHGHYLEKVKEGVENLGPNLEGTQIGLVVPSYVTIDSISEIADHAQQFENRIVGIDPGAGIMSTTEKAIEQYGLEGIKLVEGSGATMTAALSKAIDAQDWIIVTGWTPHWKFARWDLKYLEDPQGIYGSKEHIDTIVRKGLEEDMPEVYEFLDNFHWAPEEMAELMAWNQEDDADFYENAKKWMDENPERVNEWLPSN